MSGTNLEIKAVQELAQKNLEVVQKILGIESTNNFDEDEFVEQEIVSNSVSKNLPLKKLTADELDEQKHYLAEEKLYLSAYFADNQAKFAQLRQKFLNRPKRHQSSKNLKSI